jgi:hypothetical protein
MNFYILNFSQKEPKEMQSFSPSRREGVRGWVLRQERTYNSNNTSDFS